MESNEENPVELPHLSAEEELAVDKLEEADHRVIEATILGICSQHWRKVAWVVSRTEDELKTRYPGLTYVFFTEYLDYLVDEGCLELKGYIYHIRHSEVRLLSTNTSNEAQAKQA